MLLAITGSTGFIGSAVVECALKRTGMTLRASTRRQGASTMQRPSIEYIVGDVRDPEFMRRFVMGADAVIHTAVSVVRSPEAAGINCRGAENIASALRALPQVPLVATSTTSVYGNRDIMGESALSAPKSPISTISQSRSIAEEQILASNGTVVRSHLVLGDRDRWCAPGIRQLTDAVGAAPEADHKVSVIQVEELAEILLELILVEDPRSRPEVFHGCSSEPWDIEELVRESYSSARRDAPTQKLCWKTYAETAAALDFPSHHIAMLGPGRHFEVDTLLERLGR